MDPTRTPYHGIRDAILQCFLSHVIDHRTGIVAEQSMLIVMAAMLDRESSMGR